MQTQPLNLHPAARRLEYTQQPTRPPMWHILYPSQPRRAAYSVPCDEGGVIQTDLLNLACFGELRRIQNDASGEWGEPYIKDLNNPEAYR